MRQCLLPIFLFAASIILSARSYGQKWTELNPPLNLFNNTIEATALDTGGTIYAAGDFTNSNNAYFVARFTDSSWSELGQGASALNANGKVLTLLSRGSYVYAAGFFTDASGKNYVARWDGMRWEELGAGANALNANNIIYSVTMDKTGNIYAAGRFTDSAGEHYVAKWNGTSWGKVGSNISSLNANGDIFTITTDSTGNLYAGGYFTNAAGKYYVAKWNGTTWSETGSGAASLNANSFINCLATDANGNLYAGGDFHNDSNNHYLAKWNGATWSNLGYLAGYLSIKTIAIKSSAEIYTAGYSPYTYNSVAKWNGTLWSEVNSPQSPLIATDAIVSLQVDAGGNVVAGGKFTNISGHQFVARWDGIGWNEPGKHGDPFYTSQPIYQVIGDSVGNIYVSGNFLENGGRSYLEHWNGNGWQSVQLPDTSTLFLFINGAHNMKLDKKGNLYVTGRHIVSISNEYDCILKWDGVQWSILEDFSNSLKTVNNNSVGINEIETDPQGNIYVAGSFNDSVYGLCSLAKWDGKTWSRLPGSAADYIQQFCVSGDGNIYAYGGFTNSVGRACIDNYNPAKHFNWEEVKNGSNELSAAGFNIFMALAIDSSNNLYVNGDFTDSAGNRYVAKWDEDTWSKFGVTNSLGWTLALDHNNNIHTSNGIGGYSSGDPVQKWNGTSWISIGAPLDANGVYPSGKVLTIDAAGDLYTDALSSESGVGSYIAKYAATAVAPPKLSSFAPANGSLGTTVTIKGNNLDGAASVSFGGTKAASFIVNNDSTITAIVDIGSTGSVKVTTATGSDSLWLFTYSCDSISQPVPVISSIGDSILISSTANYYQWFFNNHKLNNEVYKDLYIEEPGFYRVETSANNLCWVASLDYPVLVNRSPLSDSLKMSTYPNPSGGNFTVDVKLPQTTTVLAYVAVYDLNGVQVLQTNKLIFYGSEIKIPVTITSKGTFFIKVFVNGDSRQQTIVVM